MRTTKEIVETFPSLFKYVKYFEHDEGWNTIIYNLCTAIQRHIQQNERRREWAKDKGTIVPYEIPPVVVQQVKEKLGGLRFYYSGGDDYIAGAVTMAELMADHTCEVCGTPGTLINFNGLLKTVCKDHETVWSDRN